MRVYFDNFNTFNEDTFGQINFTISMIKINSVFIIKILHPPNYFYEYIYKVLT